MAGYFPRGQSMLRKVHEERAVGLFYGQRALCVGAVKPLTYVGTSLHTHNRSTPFRRLSHTGEMFETIFFGSCAEADRVLEAVQRMHEQVAGELPEAVGIYPAGTPYSAFDPELMLWTVAVIADSAEWFYDRLVRRMRDSEREALWQDYLRFGELFGMPLAAAPASHSEFREWYAQQLGAEDLHLTEEARYMGHASAFQIPMPPSRQPGKRLHDLIMLCSLPERVRELYGLRCTPMHHAVAGTVMASSRRARPLLPRRLALGSCIPEFRMVAETERRRIARGLPTPQLSE
jgi:uncharacterized protein (DUF2236 family)